MIDVHFTQVWVRRSCKKPGWASTKPTAAYVRVSWRTIAASPWSWAWVSAWIDWHYDKHGWCHCNRPEHANKQVMQQPIKRVASTPQCLKLMRSARESVANCLNIIGRKVVCFEVFSTDGFISGFCCWAQGLWRCQPCPKTHFFNSLDRRQLSAMTPEDRSLLVLQTFNLASCSFWLKLGWSVHHWIPQGV